MVYKTWITTANLLRCTAAYPAYADGSYHRGFDTKVPNDTNTVLRAPTDAEIIRSEMGTGNNATWGNFICGYNSAGNFTWLVAHLNRRDVQVGAIVKAGDVIGIYGETGNVTGPHAHWEKHTGRGITNILSFPDYVGIPNAVGTYAIEYGGTNPPDPPSGKVNIKTIASSIGFITSLTQAQSQEQLSQMIQYKYLQIGG